MTADKGNQSETEIKKLAIYVLDDDNLKFCGNEKERPTKFATTGKGSGTLVVLKREQK